MLNMNRLPNFLLIAALAFFVSCGKQRTEEEKNAEIERQVQQRLAAEHQADEQRKLAQREADVAARETAITANSNAPAPAAAPEMRASRDQRETDESESAGASEPESGGSGGYDTFYSKLEPYGSWRETSDYGYVFQPNTAEQSRNWRPYTDGRWVYTQAGWTWKSDEPFGWATYHYGRWTRLRNVGWVWVPGDEWAPAWVSWRKGNDYVGWAPLPPEARFERGKGIHHWADNYYDIGPEQYAFVPTNDFGNQELARAVVAPERNVTIISQTTNVTNITYNNTLIVNQGPDYDELRKHTRQPIEHLRLDRQTGWDGQNPRAVVRGEMIEMPAPVIEPSRRGHRPRNVKETVAQTVVDHGWTGIGDRQAAEKARAKMKAEATPPPDGPSRKFVKPVAAPAAPAPAASATPVITPSVRPTPAVAKPVAPKPALTASPATFATPARNLPQRGKFTPTPTVVPSATASTQGSVGSGRHEAERKRKEELKVAKEKKRATQEAAQRQKQSEEASRQQKSENIRKAKTAAKPTPAAVSPASSAIPRATASKPPDERKKAKPAAAPASTASPAEEHKNRGGKKENRRDHANAPGSHAKRSRSPSPSP